VRRRRQVEADLHRRKQGGSGRDAADPFAATATAWACASRPRARLRFSVRLLEKQAILKADSIEALFRQWHEAYCQKNKKGHHDILRSFELHVFPKIGQLPAEKVTLHEWLALLEKQAEARPGITDRILTNAKQMLKWGVKRRLIPADPLAEISARHDLQIKKGAGFRSLSHDEMSCHQW